MKDTNTSAVASDTTQVRNDKELYYATLRANLNAIHKEIQNAPDEFKIGYQISPGGVLNAYREGDIDFKTAINHLEKFLPKLVRCEVFSVDFKSNKMTIILPNEVLEKGITAGDVLLDMQEITLKM